MLVKRGKDSKGYFYQWGNRKKYYYKAGNIKSRENAKKLSQNQGKAIYSSGWKKKMK